MLVKRVVLLFMSNLGARQRRAEILCFIIIVAGNFDVFELYTYPNSCIKIQNNLRVIYLELVHPFKFESEDMLMDS